MSCILRKRKKNLIKIKINNLSIQNVKWNNDDNDLIQGKWKIISFIFQ